MAECCLPGRCLDSRCSLLNQGKLYRCYKWMKLHRSFPRVSSLVGRLFTSPPCFHMLSWSFLLVEDSPFQERLMASSIISALTGADLLTQKCGWMPPLRSSSHWVLHVAALLPYPPITGFCSVLIISVYLNHIIFRFDIFDG